MRSGPQVLDDLVDLRAAGLALLADVDRHAESRLAGGLDERRELAVRIVARRGAGAGDVDADDAAAAIADRLFDDDLVLGLRERPVHHQDEAGADLRVLEAREVEAAGGGHDDVVEVALAAAVSLHRVEAHLERRDVLLAVGAADRAVHRALDGQRARLDELGPLVDRVELGEPFDAARVDRYELDEVPEVLDGERDALLVRHRPHDRRVDRAAEVRVELCEPAAADLFDGRRVGGGLGDRHGTESTRGVRGRERGSCKPLSRPPARSPLIGYAARALVRRAIAAVMLASLAAGRTAGFCGAGVRTLWDVKIAAME